MATHTIRPAVPADADVLTALMRSCATYRMAPYASVLDQVVVTEDRIRRDVAYAPTDDKGEIVGFYVLVRDPPELDMLFVSDAAQGQGMGRQLVEHMLTEAGKAGLADVRVVSHPPAEGFYRRLGAEWTDTVPVIPPAVMWERPAFVFRV